MRCNLTANYCTSECSDASDGAGPAEADWDVRQAVFVPQVAFVPQALLMEVEEYCKSGGRWDPP